MPTLLQRTKRASLGADAQDVPFEQAFSQIAHAYLRDKAPALLDYEVGFQLLERNEDDSRAVGICAFKIGTRWMYAPVFFIDGDLKGHELLFLKDQNLFVPLKENWVQYLLNRKPLQLGKETPRNGRDLGISAPNFNNMRHSPRSKYAEAFPAHIRDVLPQLAAAATSDPFAGCQPALPEFLKRASPNALRGFAEMLSHFPKFASAVAQFYAPAAIREAVAAGVTKAAGQRSLLANLDAVRPPRSVLDGLRTSEKRGEVQVVTYDKALSSNVPLESYSPSERDTLHRSGMLVKDERGDDDVSRLYRTELTRSLTNPTESGLYDVLVKPGKFEKCVVLFSPKAPGEDRPAAVVLRAGSPSQGAAVVRPGKLWVGATYPQDEFRDWVKARDNTELPDSGRSRYVVITETGAATMPFTVSDDGGSDDNRAVYFDSLPYDSSEASSRTCQPCSIGDNRIRRVDRDGGSIRIHGSTVYIPKNAKVLVVDKRNDNLYNLTGAEYDKARAEESANTPLEPGDHLDIELALGKMASTLKVWTDGCEAEVNGRRMPIKRAFIDLVCRHGLREAPARVAIKEAQAAWEAGRGAAKFLIKYADIYPQNQGPTAPGMPDFPEGNMDAFGQGIPASGPQMQELPVQGMETDPTTLAQMGPEPPSQDLMRVVQQASQTGQREVFDTAAISSLLRVSRDDLLIDQHMGDMMKGMDRVGRMLFLFYWNRDKFADRYGDNDLPEIEDSLRNTFDQLGDLILFLKQKTIEPEPEAAASLGPFHT